MARSPAVRCLLASSLALLGGGLLHAVSDAMTAKNDWVKRTSRASRGTASRSGG